jgi:hypothetical protein
VFYFLTSTIFIFIWRVLAHDAFHWSQMTSYRRCSWGHTKHLLRPLITVIAVQLQLNYRVTGCCLPTSELRLQLQITIHARCGRLTLAWTTPSPRGRAQVPSSHIPHRRAESRPLPPHRSPPQHIGRPVPIITMSAPNTGTGTDAPPRAPCRRAPDNPADVRGGSQMRIQDTSLLRFPVRGHMAPSGNAH